MKLLLDTHAFIWWIRSESRLSTLAVRAIEDKQNELLLSSASIWEMAIKYQRGKLKLHGPLRSIVLEFMADNEITELPISIRHSCTVADLPPLHKDPFDRILVAQAMVEDVPILTVDPLIRQYSVVTIW